MGIGKKGHLYLRSMEGLSKGTITSQKNHAFEGRQGSDAYLITWRQISEYFTHETLRLQSDREDLGYHLFTVNQSQVGQ